VTGENVSEDDHPPARRSRTDDPGFAPEEPTDGRVRGEWQTRYTDVAARAAIRIEAIYVSLVFLLCPTAILLLAVRWPRNWLEIDITTWDRVAHWGFVWFGGMLGGSLFAMKWMYHSVAKGLWNQDRRLWRLFTPLLSAGVGFTVVVLSSSRVLPLFGPDLVRSNTGATGVAILVGYFSDQTISRLAAMAEGHLGRSRANGRRTADIDAPETER
jgi:hypothetical protein